MFALLDPRRSLRVRFALVLGVSGLLFAVTAAFVVEHLTTQQLEANAGQAVRREADLVGRALAAQLSDRLNLLRHLAADPVLASGVMETADVRDRLERLRATQPELAWLAMVGADGLVQVSTGNLLIGEPMAHEPWFATGMLQPWLGKRGPMPRLSPNVPLTTEGRPPDFLDMAVPLIDYQGRHVGLIVGLLHWDWLTIQHQSLGHPLDRRNGLDTLVLGRDGRVASGPADLIGQTVDWPGVMAMRRGGAPGVVRWPDGQDYLTALAADPVRAGEPSAELSVVARQNLAQAFGELRSLHQRLLWAGVLATLIFVTLSVLLADRVARPIALLSAAAQRRRLGQAVSFATATGNSRDELGRLANALAELDDELRELHADLEHRVADRTAQLQAANAELDSFAYAVSHDLRAPLRALSGFAMALKEDHAAALDERGLQYLGHIESASHRMGDLIEGLLVLSRVTRGTLHQDTVALSAVALRVLADLEAAEPLRQVEWQVQPGLQIDGDARLIDAVMRNLLGNAWKYSEGRTPARIEVRGETISGRRWITVRDNGAGFNMAYAGMLFKAFERLHRQDEFPGLGIGLATVLRIVQRHGGEIVPEGEVNGGATFRFTLDRAPLTSVDAPPAP